MRDSIKSRCEDGDHPGRKEGEDCLKYAKRIASMTYAKKHGKSPQEAEKESAFIDKVEEFLIELKYGS